MRDKSPFWIQAGIGLFISIMASAVDDVEPPVFYVVDEAVFFVDTAAVFALQVTGKGFRFSNPFHAAVPFNILDELVDPELLPSFYTLRDFVNIFS